MSYSPNMQNLFGKQTDFNQLASTVGDASAYGFKSQIKGDLIKEEAKNRAEMRIMAGEAAKAMGQAAGSAATTGGIMSGLGSIAGGVLNGMNFGSSRPSMSTPISGVNDNPFGLSGGIKGVSGGSPVDSTFGIPETFSGFGNSSIG